MTMCCRFVRVLLVLALFVGPGRALLAADGAAAASAVAEAPVAEVVGRVSFFVGEVELQADRQGPWTPVELQQGISSGQRLRTGSESRVELLFEDGSVVRLGEESLLDLSELAFDDQRLQGKAELLLGRLWSKLKKLGDRGLEVRSPTAVMAVRGTTFRAEAKPDTTVQLWVYEGRVDVNRRRQAGGRRAGDGPPVAIDAPVAVGGPVAVPGPHAVSLEDWLQVVGRMSFRLAADGTYQLEKFDDRKDAVDPWVAWNRSRDRNPPE